jgi:predicted nucleotidyltransferase
MNLRRAIKKELTPALQAIICKYPIETIYLFGSGVESNKKKKIHDIDIGILLAKKKVGKKSRSGYGAEIEIEAKLQNALHLAGKIDVRVLNHADPIFVLEVIKKGFVLFEKKSETRINFEFQIYKMVEEKVALLQKMRRYRREYQ